MIHGSRIAAVLAVVSFAWLAGCKSSQGAGAHMSITKTAAGAEAPVELDDYVIRMPETLPAGEIVLHIRNVGKHVHNIEIQGHGVDAALPDNLAPGQSADLRLTLGPGVYHVTCPVGPHDMLGMRMELTVTEGGAKNAE
jgi:plastocyanin